MKQRLLIFVIISLLFASCVEEFELDTEEYEPVIIVNSIFTDNNEIKVFVLKSRSIFSPPASNLHYNPLLDSAFYTDIRYEPIKNATVKITNLQNNNEELLQLQDSFFYKTTDILPHKGTSYKIEVSAPNFTSVSSEASIPSKANISSITYSGYVYTDEYDRPRYRLNVNIQDIPDEDNFYEMIVYTKCLAYNFNEDYSYFYIYPTIKEYISNDIVLQENNSWNGLTYIFSDKQFANQSHSFELLTNNVEVYDSISRDYVSQEPDNYLIELRTISEDYYLKFPKSI